MYIKPFCCTWWLSQGKAFAQLSELCVVPATLGGSPFPLEKMTDKLWLFRLRYLADIFCKVNEMSLSRKTDSIYCL